MYGYHSDGMALAIKLARGARAEPRPGRVELALSTGHDVLGYGHRPRPSVASGPAAVDSSYRLLGRRRQAVLRTTALLALSTSRPRRTSQPLRRLLDVLGRLVDSNPRHPATPGPARYQVFDRPPVRRRTLRRAGRFDAIQRVTCDWCRDRLAGPARPRHSDAAWCAELTRSWTTCAPPSVGQRPPRRRPAPRRPKWRTRRGRRSSTSAPGRRNDATRRPRADQTSTTQTAHGLLFLASAAALAPLRRRRTPGGDVRARRLPRPLNAATRRPPRCATSPPGGTTTRARSTDRRRRHHRRPPRPRP